MLVGVPPVCPRAVPVNTVVRLVRLVRVPPRRALSYRHERACSRLYGRASPGGGAPRAVRCNPAPIDATGGIAIGNRPPIEAVPRIARAAARWLTGKPLQAIR